MKKLLNYHFTRSLSSCERSLQQIRESIVGCRYLLPNSVTPSLFDALHWFSTRLASDVVVRAEGDGMTTQTLHLVEVFENS